MNKTVSDCKPLVDFLEAVLGPNSEIVLHDFTDPDHSVVDIRNGHVSGRAVGAPATDLALRIMHEGARSDRALISNYISHSDDNKPLRSASLIIREEGAVVGMLCVNTDTSLVNGLLTIANQIASTYLDQPDAAIAGTPASTAAGSAVEVESLAASTQALIASNISSLALARGLEPRQLGQSERIDIIRSLNANGMFRLKGAVAATAEVFDISEPSVYRYLQKVRKEQ